jgi:glutamyl-tRNA reductase/elongation factor P--beta-lysine ligase
MVILMPIACISCINNIDFNSIKQILIDTSIFNEISSANTGVFENPVIISKCNGTIIVVTYKENVSPKLVREKIISTWNLSCHGNLLALIKKVKFYHDMDAIKYLIRTALGLESIVIGDSQVYSQVCNPFKIYPNVREYQMLMEKIKKTRKLVGETELYSDNTSSERIMCEFIMSSKTNFRNLVLFGSGSVANLIIKILAIEHGINILVVTRNLSNKFFQDSDKIKCIEFEDFFENQKDDFELIIALENNDDTRNLIAKIADKIAIAFDLSSPSILENLNFLGKYYSLNDVRMKSQETIAKRNQEVVKAEKIIQSQLSEIDIISATFDPSINDHELITDLIKINNELFIETRSFLNSKDFFEVTTPNIVSFCSEDLKHSIQNIVINNKKYFLRQSPQAALQLLVSRETKRLFEIGKVWREHKTDDDNLNEFTTISAEMIDESLEDIYSLAWDLIRSIFSKFNNSDILITTIPLVFTYDEIYTILTNNDITISYGESLSDNMIKVISKFAFRKYGSSMFVITKFPKILGKYYHKIVDDYCMNFVVYLDGSNVAKGALREVDISKIIERLRIDRYEDIDFENLPKFLKEIDDKLPHGGFSIGVERLLGIILKLYSIYQTRLFKRFQP